MNTNQLLGIDIIIRRCKANNKRADIFVRITVNGQPKELSSSLVLNGHGLKEVDTIHCH